MEKLYKEYGEQVQFLVIYIREAHPTDGWQVRANEQEKILVEQPTSLDERIDVASKMCTELKLTIPTVIDQLDDKVGKAYAGWPDRLYLVDTQGKISYQGGPGPRGFLPDELETAIRKELKLPATPSRTRSRPDQK